MLSYYEIDQWGSSTSRRETVRGGVEDEGISVNLHVKNEKLQINIKYYNKYNLQLLLKK